MPFVNIAQGLGEIWVSIVNDAGLTESFLCDRAVGPPRAGDLDPIVMHALARDPDRRYSRAKQMAHDIAPIPNPRELDMLLTAGERIAMSLLAIAINDRGHRAASYTGSQAGIITDTHHGNAKIIDIGSAIDLGRGPARRMWSPVYAAPEVLDGGPVRFEAR